MFNTERQSTTPPPDYAATQEQYNSFHKNGLMEAYIEEAIEVVEWFSKVVSKVDYKPESILDAGCRVGYMVGSLMTKFPSATVLGIDIVPAFVDYANRYGDAKVMDIHDMSEFKEKSFDSVFCLQALEHCYDVPKALKELGRVAKDVLVITLPLENTPSFKYNKSHLIQSSKTQDWLNLCWEHLGDDWDMCELTRSNGGKNYLTLLFARITAPPEVLA